MRKTVFTILAAATMATTGCHERNANGPGKLSSGVAIEPSNLALLQDRTARAMTSAPPVAMKGFGLAGVLGGARIKLLKAGTHEVLLPLPQLTDSQTPVCYAIVVTPQEAGKEYRLSMREESNAVVTVQLLGGPAQEVRIDWSAVVLLASRSTSPDRSLPEPYLRATACVQSGARPVRALAEKLWPDNGRIDGYAANIQEFIRGMKQGKPPVSMDAVGILKSGGNWICTANANLAAALLRAKNVPARSIATIPPTGQRLEMHRIVECYDAGQWHPFDPSSLQKGIPLKSWQNIVMARTTIADEEKAMKPRMGSSVGCPYGQELELLDGAITLWGTDFFWTIGKPLAEFEAGVEAINLAKAEWSRFLETGKLSHELMNAALATNLAGFLEALRGK